MTVARQAEARFCGITYLVTIASGLFAEAYVRGGLPIKGDAVATLAKLQASETLFRIGIASDLLMLTTYIIVTVLLYRLFRETNAALSAVAAGFSLIGIAILSFAVVALLSALFFAGSSEAEGVMFALKIQSITYGVSLVFFGVYCCLIGAMILRSGLLPKWVAGAMLLAGIAFLVNNLARITAPEFAAQIPPITMLTSLIGEGALGLWLAIFGVRPAISQTQLR
jgi:Domain of unknown function (DUF4386)